MKPRCMPGNTKRLRSVMWRNFSGVNRTSSSSDTVSAPRYAGFFAMIELRSAASASGAVTWGE